MACEKEKQGHPRGSVEKKQSLPWRFRLQTRKLMPIRKQHRVYAEHVMYSKLPFRLTNKRGQVVVAWLAGDPVAARGGWTEVQCIYPSQTRSSSYSNTVSFNAEWNVSSHHVQPGEKRMVYISDIQPPKAVLRSPRYSSTTKPRLPFPTHAQLRQLPAIRAKLSPPEPCAGAQKRDAKPPHQAHTRPPAKVSLIQRVHTYAHRQEPLLPKQKRPRITHKVNRPGASAT